MNNIKLTVNNFLVVIFMMIFTILGFIGNVKAAEGDVWITPDSQNVIADQSFDIEILTDTGGKVLGAFNFLFNFDETKMTIDTTIGETPITGDAGINSWRGFNKGTDASNYSMMSNSDDIANGNFRVGGIAATGGAAGDTQNIVIIKAKALVDFTVDTSNFSVSINELTNELGFGFNRGDVDGSEDITMNDAFLVARYSMGLPVDTMGWVVGPQTGNANCSKDINGNETTTMSDAFLIARKSMGLSVDTMDWCVDQKSN